jgi:hypothetical protein
MSIQVRVGVVKRSRKMKSLIPHEITGDHPAVPKKLGRKLTWHMDRTLRANYQNLDFCYDANRVRSSVLAGCSQAVHSKVASMDVCIAGGNDGVPHFPCHLRALFG